MNTLQATSIPDSADQLPEFHVERQLWRLPIGQEFEDFWPEFCSLVASGQVPEDFAGPGIISRCVIGWAKAKGAA
jgi:hypothetical protein